MSKAEKPTRVEVTAYNSDGENAPYVMTEHGAIVIDSNEVVWTIAKEIMVANWATDEELARARAGILHQYITRIDATLEELRGGLKGPDTPSIEDDREE